MSDTNPNNQIPALTTKETATLRSDYPSIEHLEAGNAASWLVERLDQLLIRAKTGRAEMNISKLITLAGTVVGAVCYATSPLAPIGAIIAGVGYIWAVGRDLNDSHNFAPIPFIRGDFLAFLSAMGDSAQRDEWFCNKNEILDLVLHLDPFERYEFVMLRDFGNIITEYLSAVEPGKKFYAYRWLLDRYIDYKGSLPNKDSLNEHLTTVQVDPRINPATVKAIAHHALAQRFVDVMADQRAKIIEPPAPRILDTPPIGTNTKLNAINTSASSVDESSNHKHQWVNQVLKLPFRVISGEQGSGKSTLERWMISLLKEAGYYVVVVNPETNPSVWRGVKVLSTAGEINEFFGEFIESVRDRQHEARVNGIDEDDYFDFVKKRKGQDGLVAIFLMESNTYEVHGVDPTLWADFLKQCLTNIRKWGFTACLTAHSDNQTSIASKLKGFSSLLDAQPRIDCIAIPDPNTGEATSSGKGLLKMKGTSDPTPQTIKLFNYPKTKDFRTEQEKECGIVEDNSTIGNKVESEPKPKPKLSEAINNLENSFKLDAAKTANEIPAEEIDKSSPQLSDTAQKVLEYFNAARNKEPKKLHDMKKADRLKDYSDLKLIIALTELVNDKQLTFDGESAWSKSDW